MTKTPARMIAAKASQPLIPEQMNSEAASV